MSPPSGKLHNFLLANKPDAIPDGLASELHRWKLECKDRSAEAFIFPNTDGGFIDTANYRFRVLKPLAEKLGIEKLNFQILRRTMATQAQSMGSIKDSQAHLRHARPDTTACEYMQLCCVISYVALARFRWVFTGRNALCAQHNI
jgi:hypothetical protein